MLRLIIVDDERIIRETIRNLIDWSKIEIEVVGICKNGIEAYDMILDEYPDIVLTDIKMPGISGLELIERVSQLDYPIEFIILSGYGEFSFAKQAMRYGVKHYLLKPCNEEQIVEVMEQAAKDCYKNFAKKAKEQQQTLLLDSLHQNVIRNVITEGLSLDNSLDTILQPYEKFLDFCNTSYQLFYVYFLQENTLTKYLTEIRLYTDKYFPGVEIFGIYVKNTLIFFFRDYHTPLERMGNYISTLKIPGQEIQIEYEAQPYPNLTELLSKLLYKLKRYEVIFFINEDSPIPIYNHNALLKRMEQVSALLFSKDEGQHEKAITELKDLIITISDLEFLKTLVAGLFLKYTTSMRELNPMEVTEFLLKVNQQTDKDSIQALLFPKIEEFFSPKFSKSRSYKDFIEKTRHYVEENLSNPNLSLKWIAENYLYMNVDYVSKQFIKETGQKFSDYLTTCRINKAKELLLGSDTEKIYSVAEQVGCGNNPQYFSQIFKKQTGMTPSAYIKEMGGE